jgi:hypothetical protein
MRLYHKGDLPQMVSCCPKDSYGELVEASYSVFNRPFDKLSLTLFCNCCLLISYLWHCNFHPAKPQHRISVPLKSGLTNFSDSADPATPLTFKENGEALMNAAENYNTNE